MRLTDGRAEAAEGDSKAADNAAPATKVPERPIVISAIFY
jgi:hypothetical protein